MLTYNNPFLPILFEYKRKSKEWYGLNKSGIAELLHVTMSFDYFVKCMAHPLNPHHITFTETSILFHGAPLYLRPNFDKEFELTIGERP